LVNLMLHLEVVRVGSGPVAVQSCSNVPVFHLNLPSCMRHGGRCLHSGISPERTELPLHVPPFATQLGWRCPGTSSDELALPTATPRCRW
jgi:hypothetical protein